MSTRRGRRRRRKPEFCVPLSTTAPRDGCVLVSVLDTNEDGGTLQIERKHVSRMQREFRLALPDSEVPAVAKVIAGILKCPDEQRRQ